MTTDAFDSVVEQEQAIVRNLDDRHRALEAKIRAIKSILVLRASPGWKEYVDSIRANADGVVRKALAEGTTNRDYWSGYSKGLSFLIGIMDAGESELVRLESQFSDAVKTRRRHVTETGRVVPGGI